MQEHCNTICTNFSVCWSVLSKVGCYVWANKKRRMSPTVVAKSFGNDIYFVVCKVCFFSVCRLFCHMFPWYTKSIYVLKVFIGKIMGVSIYNVWPLFFKTSTVRSGMLDISYWAKSWLIAIHSCHSSSWSTVYHNLWASACFEEWPQVLYGIEIQGVAWPQIPNVNVMFFRPLLYHSYFVT